MDDLLNVGEKRINLMRLFNLREGDDASFDVLPKKVFEPLTVGKTDGRSINAVEFKQVRRAYYRLAGWEAESGIPEKSKIDSLGIGWACKPNEPA
jgi:aldehyde:ferredoxin oxidoreductase